MILQGDLFDVLPTLDAESFDACVTDPPYGIGFMGREWDTFKPGPHRQADRLARGERIVSDNPNINGRHRSPAISESQIEYDYSVKGLREFQAWSQRWAVEVLRVLKPGAYLVVCGAPRSYHRMACGLEDAGFVIRDKFSWLFGSGFPKNHDLGDGRGTALKPAHEPIALAWKPFKGSIAGNVAKHGTGALNIDACRIEHDGDDLSGGNVLGKMPGTQAEGWERPWMSDPDRRAVTQARKLESEAKAEALGRWPANVLLDEEAAALLDEQTGELTSGAVGHRVGDDAGGNWRAAEGRTDPRLRGSDYFLGASSGGASRFYYVAKPSRAERDSGGARNIHPTVKPVELMRWLVRLVTPPDGKVVDPFTGSGTTGMACRYEMRKFVGIEREEEYAQIAERRIAAVAPLFNEQSA